MKQTIYIDVLIATNIFINYFLLLAVAKFLHSNAKRWRLVLASVLGAAYSLVILAPPINPWLFLLIKLAMSATMISLAFVIKSVKSFLRNIACFYCMNFAFAGIMLALWYFISPQGLIVKNSVVYFNVSPLLLLTATVACYFGIKLLNRAAGRPADSCTFCRLIVEAGGEKTELMAKVDTGNSLKEPFSGFPVTVAQYESVKQILPDEVKQQFCVNMGGGGCRTGLRMVPFHAVGGEGLLPAFRPEKVIVVTKDSQIELTDIYVAVCKTKVSETFEALLNPEMLSQGEQITIRGKKR